MTNETRNRIEAYKKALPEMRERVMAATFLMVMSIVMMTSATFAWITLSRAPEVTGMQTTIAANGNLEIALAQGSTVVDGKKVAAVVPGESQEGDSSAAEDQDIVEANKTWGNLVNVSDPTYGLKDIALRPALLSGFNRTDYPLNGATYGGDGRVVTTNDRYVFASYVKNEIDNTYYFGAGDDVNYGVRAITSVKYDNVTGNARIDKFSKDTDQLYQSAQEHYKKIVSDERNEVNTLDKASGETCIDALQGLVTVFAQDKVNGFIGSETKSSCSKYLWPMYQMMLLLDEVLEMEGKAILEMANWQAYAKSGQENTFDSIDDVTSRTTAKLKELGVTITTLEDYKKSVNTLDQCISDLYPMADAAKNGTNYYWDNISGIINKLVDIESAEFNGTKMSQITNDIDKVLDAKENNPAIIVAKKGLLMDIEKRLVGDDYQVDAKVKVTVSMIISYDVYGIVRTGAYGTDPSRKVDFEYSETLAPGTEGEAVAKDTYGLALDVWVRTNYPDAVLTLEGAAIYEDVPATITIEGENYDLYTISVGEGETQTEVDIYQKDDTWYYANTMMEVSSEDMAEEPGEGERKYDSVIVGYEGENRVWEDWKTMLELGHIKQDATTQGAGSCFVFYADTPTEQVKILEMLEAFNVAFMDQNGNILGTAKLNTDSAYANQGKVTVPLEIDSGTDYTDEEGNIHKGITTLMQNTPTMITAIVYLNGSKIQNENVLAEGELEGQLNIQFGTDSVLIAPRNEELELQARTITAELTVNGETIKDGTIGGIEGLEYKKGGYPATVKLTVEGEQPERISGFFVRVINSTQGTRGEEVEFTKNEDGTWTGNFKLENPGTYAFNTLIVDGVQYTLHDGTDDNYEANRPYVYIRGLRVLSASVGEVPGIHMTADSSMEFPVTVEIEAAVEPKQVNAQFFSTDDKNKKQYTAILTYDSINNQWKGSANISSSGTYTLKYITVDGVPMDAPATGSYTLYLGLTARITTTLAESAWEFNYKGPSQITMRAQIYDDGGNPIKNLSDVQLVYNNIVDPATMTWDSAGYYEGVFDIIQPGELTFKRLELGEPGTIYNVSNSPTFMAISLEKPVYLSASADLLQTVIAGTEQAEMIVNLDAAQTASVYAVVEHDPDDEDDTDTITTYYIESNELGNKRTFTLPKLDGTWTLKQLWLQNVYDPDYADSEGSVVGKWYGKTTSGSTETEKYTTTPLEGEHFVFDTEVVETEVVANYYVTLKYDGQEKKAPFTEAFGGTDSTFMTSHNSKVLTVEVSDYKGRAIDGVDSVKWEITHNAGTMKSYGGYTGTGESTRTITMTLKDDSDTVYEAPVQEFHVAGQYTSTIAVMSVNNTTIKSLTEVPTFEVRSKAPSVTISAITPTRSNPAKITYTTESLSWGRGTEPTFTTTGNQTSSYTANDATIYAVATADNSTQRHASFTQPTLTLMAEGVNGNSTVNVVLPAGSANEIVFTRTGNGTMKMTLGKVEQIKTWTSWYVLTHTLSAYYGHGTQKISSMKVTYGGVDYTVTLDTPITINNPSSVNQ